MLVTVMAIVGTVCGVGGLILISLIPKWTRQLVERRRQNQEELCQMWEKLNVELMKVSLLVSRNCTNDAYAHDLVIRTAKYLAIPPASASRFGMDYTALKERYQAGFEALKAARALADSRPR